MTKKTPMTTFCITGALDKFKRIDAIVEIHNKTNARFVSGVSGQTDYLISSRKDTTKAKRAKIIRWVNKLTNREGELDFDYMEKPQSIHLSRQYYPHWTGEEISNTLEDFF